MGKILGAVNLPQILTFIFGTVLVYVVNAAVPAGGLHDALISLLPNILALLLVLVRKPSSSGGTAGK